MWAVSETSCLGLHGPASIRKLLRALGTGYGGAESRLRFTLSRLLEDGTVLSVPNDATDAVTVPALSTPRYDRALGCAINVSLTGRNTRVFVLDLLRHVQVRL